MTDDSSTDPCKCGHTRIDHSYDGTCTRRVYDPDLPDEGLDCPCPHFTPRLYTYDLDSRYPSKKEKGM